MSQWTCDECGAHNPPQVDVASVVGTTHMARSEMKCTRCGNRWTHTSYA